MEKFQEIETPQDIVDLLILTFGANSHATKGIHHFSNLEEFIKNNFAKAKKTLLHESDFIGQDYLKYLISESNRDHIFSKLISFDAKWVRNNDLHIDNLSKFSDGFSIDKDIEKNVWRLEECEVRDNWINDFSKDLISENLINIIIMLPRKVDGNPRWDILDLCGYESGSYKDAFRILSGLAILGLNYRNKNTPELSSTFGGLLEVADVFSGCCYRGDDEFVENYGFSRNQIVFVKNRKQHELNSRAFHLNFGKLPNIIKEWVVRDKLGDYDEVTKNLLIPLSLASGTLIRLKLRPIEGVKFGKIRFLLPKIWLSLFKNGQAENRNKDKEKYKDKDKAIPPFKQPKTGNELDDIYFPAPQDLKDLKSLLRR